MTVKVKQWQVDIGMMSMIIPSFHVDFEVVKALAKGK